MRRANFLVLALLLALLLPLLAADPAGAVGVNHIYAVRTHAVVNADGSMDVTEELDLEFDDGSHGGSRSFDAGTWTIVDFRVTEDGAPRDLAPGFEEPNFGREVRWFGSDDHDGEISGRHVYTLTYTVRDAVEVHPDTAVLYWQFVGAGNQAIDQVAVDITFPGDGTDLRAFGHGALQGIVTPIGNDVALRVADNPAGQFVETRVTLPPSNFVVTPSGEPVLDEILAEEAADAAAANAQRAQAQQVVADRFADAVDGGQLPAGCTDESSAVLDRRCDRLQDLLDRGRPRVGQELTLDDLDLLFAIEDARDAVDDEVDRIVDARNARILDVTAPVVAALAAGAWFFVWRRFGKEPDRPSDVGDYWREVPEESPAVIAAVDDWGVIDSKAFATTIIDLAQRGWLTISQEGRKDHRFTRSQQTQDELPLRDYESKALWKLFDGGRPTITQKELVAEAKKDRTGSASWMSAFKKQVHADYERQHFQEKQGCVPWLLHGLLLLVAGGASAAAFAFRAWIGGGVAAGVFVVLLLCSPLLRKRTERGARTHAEVAGLKAFLRDFSLVDDVPVGHLALYERYLVYAVALGVADRLIAGLRMRFPELADPNAGFAPWYVYGLAAGGGPGGGLDKLAGLGSMPSFATDFSRATSAAFSPPSSSSGGGGGFSGGGGGGGGGGGIGGW